MILRLLNALDATLSMKFDYNWKLANGYPAKGIKYHGSTVFTTFSCGGGSSMGYKLAGYDVIGANDIDPRMAEVYKANHNPKQYILAPLKDLLTRDDLPQVDILDGSPPCSVFSMAGSREDAWQKDKVFREGQAKQVLDDLFFEFIKLADKMKPKIVIAENVKGMLIGNAKWYTREIVREFEKIGYKCQVFLLNAARMGVPQKRERVFFIAHKTDKQLRLSFDEAPIKFGDIHQKDVPLRLEPKQKHLWDNRKITDRGLDSINERMYGKNTYFSHRIIKDSEVCPTITARSQHQVILYNEPRHLSDLETMLIGSYPTDYNFLKTQPGYLIGMSVPPVMMANVAYEVYNQLIK